MAWPLAIFASIIFVYPNDVIAERVFMRRLSISLILLMSLFALPSQGNFFQCIGVAQCDGSANADVMVGDDTDNLIFGFAGNDILFGKAGRDTLRGQEGDDVLFGGTGSDDIDGNQGNDTLLPGPDDAGNPQGSVGLDGNDRFIVLAGETVNCQIISGGPDIDELHLIGFGPYVAEYPYGATPPFNSSAIVIQDPVAGGFIFVLVFDNIGLTGVVERITGLPTPNVAVLPDGEWQTFQNANCVSNI
jgi:hypothetical protein